MRTIALLDSCVLYPMPLRDILLRASEAKLFQVRFSEEILDGATRNLIQDKRMTPEKAQLFQSMVLKSFPEALVEVPDNLIAVMTNHLNDRHVIAAAIVSHAEIIVTSNLKHFPKEALSPWNIIAQHPDNFLVDLCDLHGVKLLTKIIQKQAQDLKRPPMDKLELLDKLYKQTPNFVNQILTYVRETEIETTVVKKYIAGFI